MIAEQVKPIAGRKFLLILLLILSFTTSLYAQPIISSFAPLSGPAGTSVTISGSNFSLTPANNTVYFGVVKAIVTAASSNNLTVTVPAAATYQPISVTVNNLTAFSDRPFLVTFSGTASAFSAQSFDYLTRLDSVDSNIETTKYTIGDLDNDGRIDVITIDRLNNTLTIYRNITTGSGAGFAAGQVISTAPGPRACSVGDLDGDGKLDIIVSNFGSNTVSVFRNTTTGAVISFAAKNDFATATQPSVIAVSDIDKDGRPDLVVNTINLEGYVSVLRNTSSGGTISFAAHTDLTAIGGSIEEIRTVDVDGDGKQDILLPNYAQSAITVFRNTSISGTISFAPLTNITTSANPNEIELADLDADGKNDLVVGYYLGNGISIFRNTSTSGTISFGSASNYNTSANTGSMAISDLDGDGKPDLAITVTGKTGLYKNISTTGTIQFDALQTLSTFWDGTLFAADFDGDSKPDLSLKAGIFRAVIYQNQTSFPQVSSFAPAEAATGDTVVISGVNFSGITSVKFGGTPAASFEVVNTSTIKAVVGTGSSGAVSVTAPQGTGSRAGFTFLTRLLLNSFSPASAVSGTTVTITGVNLSGTTGVFFGGVPAYSFVVVSSNTVNAIVHEGASGYVTLVAPNGSDSLAGFSFTVSNTPVINSVLPASGVVGSSITITGQFFDADPLKNAVYFGPAKAVVTSATATSLVVQVPNGARYDRISVTVSSRTGYSPQPFAPIFPNGDITSTAFADVHTIETGSSPSNVCIADLDLDGKNDLSVVRAQYTNLNVLRNTSTGSAISFEPGKDFSGFSAYEFLEAVDMDGNGKKDMVVTGGFTNNVSVYTNSSVPGTISFSGRLDYPLNNLASNIRGFAMGDMDSDGRPDILILGYGSVSIIRNISFPGTVVLAPGFQTIGIGAGNKAIRTADMDGDGKTDIVLFSGNEDSIYVLRNTSTAAGISFAPQRGYGVLQASDFNLMDLNKDGKPEIIAVNNHPDFRLSVWKNNSVPGTLSFQTRKDFTNGAYQPLSVMTDDLDGDGLPDLVSANDFLYRSVVLSRNISTADTLGFATQQVYSSNSGNNGVLAGFTSGDLNNDGRPEIICPSGVITNPGQLYIFQNKTNGPVISSFLPNKGYVGTVVTITGTKFTNASTVSFGGKPAKSFTVLSSTSISAVVDSGATGNVEVSTPLGRSLASGFYYGLAPVLTSFSPAAVGTNGQVTLRGTNFNWVNVVKFGGQPANIISKTDTSIVASLTGNGATGSVMVIGDVDSSSLPGFTFVQAPIINSFTPVLGTTGTVITINGANFEWATSVYFGAVPAQSFTIVSPTQILATVGAGESGEVSVNNPWNGGFKGFFQFFNPPTISSFTPTSAGAGITITISGTNLLGATEVKIGGVAASSFTVISPTSISAVVASAAASGSVAVTTPGGTATKAGFIFVPTPVITSFTPTTAATDTTVTITGSNFTGATSVQFGGVPAASFTVTSSTSISAIPGNGASGTVSVVTPGGTATLAGFTYIPPPVITSFTPSSGATGATLTISGTGFTGATAVRFGGVNAGSFTVSSATSIAAVIGTGASGDLIVTTPGGSDTASGFSFIPAPVINSFSPAAATKGGIVTITGSNFTNVQSVSFGGTAAATFTVVNATTINAEVGNGSSGAIAVATPGGAATLAGFTYNVPTAIVDPVAVNSKDFVITPNPASGSIIIYHPLVLRNTKIQFIDILGRTVKLIVPARNSRQTAVQIHDMPPGIYQVIWRDGKSILLRTFVVK